MGGELDVRPQEGPPVRVEGIVPRVVEERGRRAGGGVGAELAVDDLDRNLDVVDPGLLEGEAQDQVEAAGQGPRGLGLPAEARVVEAGPALLLPIAGHEQVLLVCQEVRLPIAQEEAVPPEARAGVGGEGAVQAEQVPPAHLHAAPQPVLLCVADPVGDRGGGAFPRQDHHTPGRLPLGVQLLDVRPLEDRELPQPPLALQELLETQGLALLQEQLAPHHLLAGLLEARDHHAVHIRARSGRDPQGDLDLGAVGGEDRLRRHLHRQVAGVAVRGQDGVARARELPHPVRRPLFQTQLPPALPRAEGGRRFDHDLADGGLGAGPDPEEDAGGSAPLRGIGLHPPACVAFLLQHPGEAVHVLLEHAVRERLAGAGGQQRRGEGSPLHPNGGHGVQGAGLDLEDHGPAGGARLFVVPDGHVAVTLVPEILLELLRGLVQDIVLDLPVPDQVLEVTAQARGDACPPHLERGPGPGGHPERQGHAGGGGVVGGIPPHRGPPASDLDQLLAHRLLRPVRLLLPVDLAGARPHEVLQGARDGAPHGLDHRPPHPGPGPRADMKEGVGK